MIEFKISHFTFIGRQATYKQDKGLQISVKELVRLIEDGKILPWIEQNICSLDFWDKEAKQVMVEEFRSLENCDDFGIENDGMSLFISYCFIFINHLPSRKKEDI